MAPVTSSLFVAVDPGGTTGVCTLRPDPLYGFDVSFREIPDRYEAEACVRDLVVGVGPATVIVERWDVRANTHQLTNQDDPRYIIGYVDGLCHQLPGVRYVEQTPAQAKRFASDEKLRRAGLYPVGLGHARDAARHMLTFLVKDRGPAGVEMRRRLLDS